MMANQIEIEKKQKIDIKSYIGHLKMIQWGKLTKNYHSSSCEMTLNPILNFLNK